MGVPKGLLKLNSVHLVNAHVRAFADHCDQVIVVVGRHAAEITSILDPSASVIVNHNWAETHMVDSIRLAISGRTGAALITPVDCPPAPSDILQTIVQAGAPAVAQHHNRDGHPVLVNVAAMEQCRGTLQEALKGAPRIAVDWPGATENWNTPQDWARYSSMESSGRS